MRQTMKLNKAARAEAKAQAADVATTTTTTDAAVPATKQTTTKEQTPEQQARKLRADAKALRTSAEHLTGAAKKQLTVLAEQKEGEADVLAPRKAAAAASEPRPTCTATKADGTPCTAKCMKDRDVCVDHRPAVEHLTAAEVKLFEEWLNGDENTVTKVLSLVGWGKVRQAIKTGVIA